MSAMLSLWLPILLSAVFVFIVSSVVHMFLGYHNKDWSPVPDEDAFRRAVRPLGLPPGDYMVPRCTSMKDMGSPDYQAKLNEGPVLMMTVLANRVHPMGKSLTLWFLHCIVVSAFVAYLAAHAFPMVADDRAVFGFVAVAAFAAYGLADIPYSIWMSRSWATPLRTLFDALLYALVTAGTFGWLWPA